MSEAQTPNPPPVPGVLSRDELKELFAEVITEKLEAFGVDVSDPRAMQRDLQALREFRQWWEDFKRELVKKSVLAITSALIAGAITLMVFGIRAWLKSPPP
jgi:hypothetical protein